MDGNQVPVKAKSHRLGSALQNLYVLGLITAVWAMCITWGVSGFLRGDYIIAAAMGIASLTFLWSYGALYVSIPLTLYFSGKYRRDRNYAAIDMAHRRALKVLMKLPVRRTTSVAVTMCNLGLVRLCQGHYESAATLFSSSAAYLEKNRRLARGAAAVVIYNNLAVTYIRLNKYVEADLVATKALELAESAEVQKKYKIFACAPLAAQAAVRVRLGELDSAVEHYMKALRVYESSPVPPGTSGDTFEQAKAFMFLGLATATIKLGRQSESEQWCDRAWEVVQSNPSLINTLALDNLNLLANEYMNNKLFDRAQRLLELAYSIGQEQPFHPEAKQTLNYFEKLLLLTDRQSEVADMRSWLRHVDTAMLAIGGSRQLEGR